MVKNEKLGVFDCTMIVVSLVIGMGIFRTPANVAQHVPDNFLFFLKQKAITPQTIGAKTKRQTTPIDAIPDHIQNIPVRATISHPPAQKNSEKNAIYGGDVTPAAFIRRQSSQ